MLIVSLGILVSGLFSNDLYMPKFEFEANFSFIPGNLF
jgi:hypothetical protein